MNLVKYRHFQYFVFTHNLLFILNNIKETDELKQF